MSKWNTVNLQIRFKELHNRLYLYKDFEYINTDQRVTITCKIHGDFNQKIRKHLEGQGCRRCSGTKNSSKWVNPTGYREVCGKQVQY